MAGSQSHVPGGPGGSTSFAEYNTLIPQTISVTQNNLAVPSPGLRITATANLNITGIVAATTGTILLLFNVGPGDISLRDQDAGSLAPNRLYLPNNVNYPLENMGSIYIRYDAALNGGIGGWHLVNIPR